MVEHLTKPAGLCGGEACEGWGLVGTANHAVAAFSYGNSAAVPLSTSLGKRTHTHTGYCTRVGAGFPGGVPAHSAQQNVRNAHACGLKLVFESGLHVLRVHSVLIVSRQLK